MYSSKRLLFIFSILFGVFSLSPKLIAQGIFPGAQGFGSSSRGAYGSKTTPVVLTVDTLAAKSVSTSSTSGSLEWCITRSYPRIILFSVGGIIDYRGIKDQLYIKGSYCNIYGQTAPSPGITILGTDFSVDRNVHDVLVQHIRVRPGDDASYGNPTIRDAFSIYGYNVVVDHCSFSWSSDEIFAISDGTTHDITVSNCLFEQPLNYNRSVNDGVPNRDGFGPYITADSNTTFMRNLIAYSYDRSPRVYSDKFLYLNNYVIVDEFFPGPRIYAATYTDVIHHAYIGSVGTYVNSSRYDAFAKVYSNVSPSSKIYFKDIKCPRSIDNPNNSDWDNVDFQVSLQKQSRSPIDISKYSILKSGEVLPYIMKYGGAFYWDRDKYDQMILDSVKARKWHAIDSPDPLPARVYNKGESWGYQTTEGDMRNGHDWSVQNETIVVNGKQVKLTKNCKNVTEVVNYLNSILPSGTKAVKFDNPECYYIILESTVKGSKSKLTVGNVSGQNALETFGWYPGTYWGDDGAGGYPAFKTTHHKLKVPSNPHNDNNHNGYTNLEDWVFGLANPDNSQSDNTAPVINNQQFEITEDFESTDPIAKIEASDADEDQTLTYSLISGNSDNEFTVDQSGNLYYTGDIQKVEDAQFTLGVMVTDNGTPNLSDTAHIEVEFNIPGDIVYIDPSASDDRENGTMRHPFNSWQDFTWMRGRTYLQRRGTRANESKITIAADSVSIGAYGEGNMPVLSSSANDYALRVFERTSISISDIKIQAPEAVNCIYFLSVGGKNKITRCELTGSAYGVRIIEGGEDTVSYCKIYNTSEGVYSSSSRTTVIFNILRDNDVAIDINSTNAVADIYNNVIYNNRLGIQSNFSEINLYNNIFYTDNTGDISVNGDGDKLSSDHNLYYPERDGFLVINGIVFNDLDNFRNEIGADMNSIIADPEFIDVLNDNFKVNTHSPAVDAGMDVGMHRDYYGNAIPDGRMPDIGISETRKEQVSDNPDIPDKSVGFNIYPVPSDGVINMTLTDDKESSGEALYKICDSSGKQVYQGKCNLARSSVITLDLTNVLSKGCYLFSVILNNEIITKKLLIK